MEIIFEEETNGEPLVFSNELTEEEWLALCSEELANDEGFCSSNFAGRLW